MSGLSADDEAAFREYARDLAYQLALFSSVLMVFCTVLWWPLDALVMPGHALLRPFAALRARALVVEVAALASFGGSRFVRRHALVFGPAFYALLLGSFGYSLGAIGGTDLTWLGDASFGIVPAAFIPLRLRPRVLATGVIAASLPLGYFLPFPANMRAPGALSQVSFLFFAALFSLVLGEVMFRVIRGAFFQRRQLDRANAQLSVLTDTLSERVREKTRELRALANHLEQALDAERRRIARDLHDDLGQSLTAMRYTIARLERPAATGAPDAGELLEDLSALVSGASATMRNFLTELRPRILDDRGLLAAAEWLCERVGATSALACRLEASADFPEGCERPPPETALALFRVLQEASTNALKHARASELALELGVEGARFRVSVRDDGVGFDPKAARAGFGLLGLRERLEAAGGEFRVESAAGRGTRVTAVL